MAVLIHCRSYYSRLTTDINWDSDGNSDGSSDNSGELKNMIRAYI